MAQRLHLRRFAAWRSSPGRPRYTSCGGAGRVARAAFRPRAAWAFGDEFVVRRRPVPSPPEGLATTLGQAVPHVLGRPFRRSGSSSRPQTRHTQTPRAQCCAGGRPSRCGTRSRSWVPPPGAILRPALCGRRVRLPVPLGGACQGRCWRRGPSGGSDRRQCRAAGPEAVTNAGRASRLVPVDKPEEKPGEGGGGGWAHAAGRGGRRPRSSTRRQRPERTARARADFHARFTSSRGRGRDCCRSTTMPCPPRGRGHRRRAPGSLVRHAWNMCTSPPAGPASHAGRMRCFLPTAPAPAGGSRIAVRRQREPIRAGAPPRPVAKGAPAWAYRSIGTPKPILGRSTRCGAAAHLRWTPPAHAATWPSRSRLPSRQWDLARRQFHHPMGRATATLASRLTPIARPAYELGQEWSSGR
jgi:hypothetical protein